MLVNKTLAYNLCLALNSMFQKNYELVKNQAAYFLTKKSMFQIRDFLAFYKVSPQILTK